MLKLDIRIKNFEEGKQITVQKLQRILQRSMYKMEELAIRNAPHDKGEIRQKISVTPSGLSNKYLLVSAANHSEAIEYGTRPFYAPIKPLIEWSKRHGGDENMGYAVRAKIAKYGITAHPFVRPAFYQVRDFWMPIFAKEEFDSV